MLCRGAEVKIRVHERISVQAPESMQESKLFARRLQGLDEKFVNTIIRKNEIFLHAFYMLTHMKNYAKTLSFHRLPVLQ